MEVIYHIDNSFHPEIKAYKVLKETDKTIRVKGLVTKDGPGRTRLTRGCMSMLTKKFHKICRSYDDAAKSLDIMINSEEKKLRIQLEQLGKIKKFYSEKGSVDLWEMSDEK